MLMSRIIFLASLALFVPSTVFAQFFATCETASREDLQLSIHGHNQHVERMNRKFRHYWYYQGTFDASQFKLDYEEILEYLQSLDDRQAGVLFYAHRDGPSRLCAWLVSPHVPDNLVSHKAEIDIEQLMSLQTAMFGSLDIGRRASNRAPSRGMRPSFGGSEDADSHAESATATLQEASNILLPPPIAMAIAEYIDTLIIVPMTVIYGTELYDADPAKVIASEVPAMSIGTLPFAALPVDERQLVDIASVVVSPGFATFRFEPRKARRDFPSPVIVGNPSGETDSEWDFPDLPGAKAEARAIAAELGPNTLLTGSGVNIDAVEAAIKSDTGLIHLATHGIASAENPLDGSFLWLNERWSAREISELSLDKHPLVVLSACQTGLGKDFAAGTTGLARAWIQSGASSVVMSLWNVDDGATRELMTKLIGKATEQPVDQALREAMLETRSTHPDPYYWAGFTTFGAPELNQSGN